MTGNSERIALKESYSEIDSQTETQTSRKFFIPTRYIISFMMFLGCANMGILRSVISVPIVAMTTNGSLTEPNGTVFVLAPDFEWDSRLRGHILSSFFYGYLVTQVPGGWLANRFGGKLIFGLGILLTALLQLFLPVSASASSVLLIANRFLQGVMLGVCFPAIYAFMRHWVPAMERSKLMASAIAGKEIGILLCLTLSGVIVDGPGWQFVFYIFGIVGLVWFVAWWFVVEETPNQHRCISEEEKDFIAKNTECIHAPYISIPYRRIFTSPSVISIIVLDMCTYWCYYLMLAELPSYIKQVHNVTINNTGLYSGAPYLFLFCTGLISGQVADFMISTCHISATITRKTFATLCCIGFNSLLLTAAYTDRTAVAIPSIISAFAFLGLSYPTFPVAALDVAPQYASIIMGVSNAFTVLSGIISPTVTGYIVLDGTADQWRIVFIICAVIHVLGSIFYAVFGSCKRAVWAEPPEDSYLPTE